MPGGQHGGKYTGMDVGRLTLQSGVIFGNVTLCSQLEEQDFQALLRMQGPATQETYQDSLVAYLFTSSWL